MKLNCDHSQGKVAQSFGITNERELEIDESLKSVIKAWREDSKKESMSELYQAAAEEADNPEELVYITIQIHNSIVESRRRRDSLFSAMEKMLKEGL